MTDDPYANAPTGSEPPPPAASTSKPLIFEQPDGPGRIKFEYKDGKLTGTVFKDTNLEQTAYPAATIDASSTALDQAGADWNKKDLDARTKFFQSILDPAKGPDTLKTYMTTTAGAAPQPSAAPPPPLVIQGNTDDPKAEFSYAKGKVIAKVFDKDGKPVQVNGKDLTYEANVDDEQKTALAIKGKLDDVLTSPIQRLAFVKALSDDKTGGNVFKNLVDKGEVPESILKAANEPSPATPTIRQQEQWMQDIIKTGLYNPDYARDKFGAIDEDDFKKVHDKLMEYADKTSGVIPDDKKKQAQDGVNALPQTLSRKETDIRQISALLGRPAHEPDSDGSTPSEFHYAMARLSSNTVHVFRKNLEDAQKAAGDKPLSKEDIDKAMQVAIKAGDDEATSGTAWDRAATGDTDKFMHMAVNSPAGQLLQPDATKPADTTPPAAHPASSPPAPGSAAAPKTQSRLGSGASAPADVTAETINGTVFGSYVNHGHHYGVIANQQGTRYIAQDGKVRSENDHTAKYGLHSSDGSADVLMASEQARMHPEQQQQAVPGGGASPPIAYAQPQQGGVINAGMEVPGGGYPIPASPSGWGYYGALVSPGGYYDYGHGKRGYTIPGTDAYHSPGTNAYYSPGTNAYHSPGTNAYHSPGTNAFHSPGTTGPKR